MAPGLLAGGGAARWLACVEGQRGYVRKNGFREGLLGLSGGIDSAAVAAMAADAIGADAVRAVSLRTYNPNKGRIRLRSSGDVGFRRSARPVGDVGRLARKAASKAGLRPFILCLGYRLVSLPSALALREGASVPLARAQAERLGARLSEIPLLASVAALADALGPDVAAAGGCPGAAEPAGPCARRAVDGRVEPHGALLLTTGNKTEMAVGYATIYGDMCGGYSPLKDLWKAEVFVACRWRNALSAEETAALGLLGPGRPVLEEILARTPTAELEAGQSDEADLGPYPEIDAALRGLVEDLLDPEAAAAQASAALGRPVDPARVRRLAALMRRAEWKRRQAAPGPKIGPRSLGLGWRMPITAGGPPA